VTTGKFEPVRIGVAGVGSFGLLHALTLQGLAEAELVAVMHRRQERLDEILSVGAIADEEAKALTPAGETVMNIWNKLDAGAISDTTEAFDEADRRVREQQQAPAE